MLPIKGGLEGVLTSKKHVRDTLARHRDQAPVGLDLVLPLNWQLDEDVGQALSADLLGTGNKWETLKATKGCATLIPAKCGIYMFVYRSHLAMEFEDNISHRGTWVLYIGRAGNEESTRTLRNRYAEDYSRFVGGDLEQLWDETKPKTRFNNLKRYLAIYPLEYWFLVVENRSSIPQLEDRLIKIFNPPLNNNGRLKIRTGKPEPAFKEP